jgi:O-phosphoseryl-tRNA(Cys) synthetase
MNYDQPVSQALGAIAMPRDDEGIKEVLRQYTQLQIDGDPMLRYLSTALERHTPTRGSLIDGGLKK